jgi:DNA modification methylase
VTPWLDDGDVRLFLGDCVEVMAAMPAESVDAVVCDPPYGLEFMGKEWDSFRVDDPGTTRNRGERAADNGAVGDGDGSHPSRSARAAVAYGGGNRPRTWRCVGCGKRDQFRNAHACPDGTRWAQELVDPFSAPPTMLAFEEWVRHWALAALRVLKPGGHLLAFGGTRTFHRLTCGIEDAGFEVRDCLSWLYGSGFPKSLDVSKAIDKAAGAEREVVGRHEQARPGNERATRYADAESPARESLSWQYDITAPATDAAREWQGWGTALKPGWEPCVVARKPLAGTVAENVQRYGTGAVNVDGCRIGTTVETWPASRNYAPGKREPGGKGATVATGDAPPGRWPANVALDEAAAAMLDAQSGETSYNPAAEWKSSAERDSGAFLSGVNHDAGTVRSGFGDRGGASRFYYTAKASRADRNTSGATNTHPTVKPTDLMRWLVRLVTPPGGVVLDPFAGSGSTLVAARAEGFRAIGIEREQEYADIIAARLSQLSLFTEGME